MTGASENSLLLSLIVYRKVRDRSNIAACFVSRFKVEKRREAGGRNDQCQGFSAVNRCRCRCVGKISISMAVVWISKANR